MQAVKSDSPPDSDVFQLRGLLPDGLAPHPPQSQIPAPVSQRTENQGEAGLRALLLGYIEETDWLQGDNEVRH
ncbi:hypothetical protein EYF80_014949 [Liparis tanakae]|uniref:Uncharacterized protein n=1 Tax=Liparis tanakae TaxID=230148 RepID=A0A4Z2I9T6_9TELE|nr:hypothetical protein EYF80_014949 [Liparis tanakae]